MFINLDRTLKNIGYKVSDEEIVEAFKNLGYVSSSAETNKEKFDSLNNLNKATAKSRKPRENIHKM